MIANTPVEAESLPYSIEQAAGGIRFYDKAEFMYFKQELAISSLRGRLLKLDDKFMHLISNISSTESNLTIYGSSWLGL